MSKPRWRQPKERGGSVDILVTCAGIIRDNLLFKMSDDDWTAVIDTHLKGTFHAVRAAQKHMVEQKAGKMVLISSTSALGNRGQTNYATAKAGLQGMTKTLAIELGPFNVNVNCVAPGFIVTDMTRQTAERVGVPFDQFTEAAAARRAASPRRAARGRRRDDRVPLLGGRRLRQRPGDLRRGRAEELTDVRGADEIAFLLVKVERPAKDGIGFVALREE